MALTFCIQDAKFIQKVLHDLKVSDEIIDIWVDNQGAYMLSHNPMYHERSKHIDIKYHYIREEIKNGNVKLFYVNTNDNWADIFTKPVIPSKLMAFSCIYW